MGSWPFFIFFGLCFLISLSMGFLYLVSRVSALPLPHAFLKSPSANPKALAIVFSGPAGWIGFDHRLGEALSESKMDVMGIDYLRYFFWKKKTPALLAQDLTDMIQAWTQEKGESAKVVLVGYSKGADVLPFAINLLSDEMKSRIQLVTLISVSRLANFTLHLSNLLMGGHGPFALKVGPEIRKLEGIPGLCIYGNRDLVSLARNLKTISNMEVREVQGGPIFQDAQAVAEIIIKKYDKVASGYTSSYDESNPGSSVPNLQDLRA